MTWSHRGVTEPPRLHLTWEASRGLATPPPPTSAGFKCAPSEGPTAMVGIPSKRSDTAATGDPALGWQGPREVKGLLPSLLRLFRVPLVVTPKPELSTCRSKPACPLDLPAVSHEPRGYTALDRRTEGVNAQSYSSVINLHLNSPTWPVATI